MDILETNKLVLFIIFAIPGFIALKTYELLCPSERKESEKQLIDAITYSCINYAVLGIPIYLIHTSTLKAVCPFLYFSFFFFVLLLAPILWAWLWLKIRLLEKFQKNIPHPTASPWDYVFNQKKWSWAIITLNDGQKIGGKYYKNSFTSSYPEEPKIYLEETWVLDEEDSFVRRRNNTAGIIVLSKEIKCIELINYE